MPYIYDSNRLVTYDDLESIAIKAKFVIDNQLAGVSIWSLDNDDFFQKCDDYASFDETLFAMFP